MRGFLDRIEAQVVGTYTGRELDELLKFVSPSKSGVRVTAESAMRFSVVFACVRVVSEDVAKLPLFLYRRLPNGGKERAIDHWAYRLMHDKPNAWMTPYEFKEMMEGHIELRGNAYAFKTWVRGEVAELIPIHPDRVTPKQDENFNITYVIQGDTKSYREPKEILHLRGLSGDGFCGMTPVALHRETIGLGIAMRDHGSMLFGNGAQPGGILEVPGKMKKDAQDRLVQSVHERYGGENRFKTMVLEDGAKWQQVGMTSEDAQYLESRKFNRSEIAGLWRVPPHKVGDLERATFSNIEQQSLEYVTDSLLPRLTRWEERLTLELLSDAERRTMYFEFLTDASLRGDIVARYNAYRIGVMSGFLNRNEVRAKENLNPAEGLDEFFEPMNMGGANDNLDKQPAQN